MKSSAKKAAQPKVSRLGKVLREVRLARKLKACALSTLAGLSQGTVSQYEGGFRIPRKKTLEFLAGILGIPVEILAWYLHVGTNRTPVKGARNKAMQDRAENLMQEQLDFYKAHPLT